MYGEGGRKYPAFLLLYTHTHAFTPFSFLRAKVKTQRDEEWYVLFRENTPPVILRMSGTGKTKDVSKVVQTETMDKEAHIL